ncbi:MAG: GDSL-type esterase/lipase family protein [Acutalibacteraceae bacterium]|jgi:hypothetical protein
MNNYTLKNRNQKTKIIFYVLFTIIIVMLSVLFLKKNLKSDAKPVPSKEASSIKTTSPLTTKQETSKSQTTSSSNNYKKMLTVPKSDEVDNSYFDDAIFIGDSRTEGLMLYTGLNNATFYTHKGLMVNTAFTSPAINLNGKKVAVMDAVKNNKKFSKAYIMLGINELGWASPNLYIEKYSLIIDTIKATNPNAKIYVQSLIPVTQSKSNSSKVYNNENINKFNNYLYDMCKDKQVYYLNISEALAEKNGCIPEDSAYDGIHLKKPYCEKWLEYIKTHTVQN